MSWKTRAIAALPPAEGWRVVYFDCDRYGLNLLDLKGLRRCHDAMLRDLKALAKAVMKRPTGISRAKAYEDWCAFHRSVNEAAAMLKRRQRRAAEYFSLYDIDAIDVGMRKRDIFRAKLSNAAQVRRANAERRYREEQERRMREETAEAELWRRHEYKGQRYYWQGTYLRLSLDGRHVETSKGVVVPFADALRLFRFCRLSVKTGGTALQVSEPNLVKVGEYRLNSVAANGDCVVGCHRLKYTEMERCFEEAKTRGLATE